MVHQILPETRIFPENAGWLVQVIEFGAKGVGETGKGQGGPGGFVFLPLRLTIRHMPQAPPMRPMITRTGTWSAAPAIRSTIPRPSEMAPKTGPCGRFATGADGVDAEGIGP